MNFFNVIAALIIALFFTLLFSFVFKNRGPWGSFWSFFLVLFLIVLAGSVYIEPFGPYVKEVAWVPLVFIGLFIAILLGATTPQKSKQQEDDLADKVVNEPLEAVPVIGVFFWILILAMLAAIIVKYFRLF